MTTYPSSVAREAAERHFDMRTRGIWRGWPDNQREDAVEDFIDGFTECASRLPSEEEIAEVLAGGAWALMDRKTRAMHLIDADAVLALIGEKISGR